MPIADVALIDPNDGHIVEIKAHLDAGDVCVGANVLITVAELSQDDAALKSTLDDKLTRCGDAVRASLVTLVNAARVKADLKAATL